MTATTKWRNWGRTQACRPRKVVEATSEDDIREAVREAADEGARVRPVGSGHSFTDCACTDGFMLDLSGYDRLLHVDHEARTITVQAGMTLEQLNEAAAKEGLAMSNLGDIAYQTVSGAISTATHGTGVGFGNLSTQVDALSLITADGEVVHCSADEDPEVFKAAQVSLGALGVVSAVRIRCEDAFNLRADEQGAALDETLGELDELVDANEHFEFFWFPHTDRVYRKANNRTADPPTKRRPVKAFMADYVMSNWAFGVVCRLGKARPEWIPGLMQRVVADGLGRVRKVDRSDKVFASPRLVRFAEMEYAIPRECAAEALARVRRLIADEGHSVNFPVEVRFVAPDDIFLSPSFGRETCYIAVHLYKGMRYEGYFHGVERIMDDYGGRPHWGKLHFQTAETLRERYPQWDRFIAVRDRLDPEGRFRNTYLDRVLGLPGSLSTPAGHGEG